MSSLQEIGPEMKPKYCIPLGSCSKCQKREAKSTRPRNLRDIGSDLGFYLYRLTDTLRLAQSGFRPLLRARKGKLAGLLALVIALCLAASIAKTDGPQTQEKAVLTKIDYQIHALQKLRNLKEFNCLLKLYSKESAWDYLAVNGTHYGIPQGNSQWLKNQDGLTQVDWGIKYNLNRYGSMCAAYRHWSKYGWH